MINEATMDKLREMQLDVMAEAFRSQEGDPAFSSLSFGERLGLLVDAEWSSRTCSECECSSCVTNVNDNSRAVHTNQ